VSTEEMRVEQFSLLYRARMIQAYPVIARMTADEYYESSREEKDRTFRRILRAKNLEVTHRQYLEANDASRLS
jgi:hypothetical protein